MNNGKEPVSEGKKLIFATFVYLYVQQHPNCNCETLCNYMADEVVDYVDLPGLNLDTARAIAKLTQTSFNELELTKAILRSYRRKHPINYMTTTIETAKKRRCSQCLKWKHHIEFSPTSRLCKICRYLHDYNRSR